MYADTDFFLALLKGSDWLKENALKILEIYKNEITTSEATFIELMLLAERYKLDPIDLTSSVMALSNISDPTYLQAAFYVKRGVNPFDAFHAAHAGKEIISSDKVYDKIGLQRVKLEGSKEV